MEAFKGPCHILFVSRSLTADQQAALIAKTSGKPIFVVGETPGFAERGATANFFADGDRIAIEINVDAVRRAQLRVDARLLSLAKRIGIYAGDRNQLSHSLPSPFGRGAGVRAQAGEADDFSVLSTPCSILHTQYSVLRTLYFGSVLFSLPPPPSSPLPNPVFSTFPAPCVA